MTADAFARKTVLVTGAAKGIGLAIARRFAATGSAIALLDNDSASLPAAIASIPPGSRTLALELDVSESAAVDEALRRCVDTFGGLDVLVNNAGTAFARAIDAYSLDEIDRILSVNLKGALFAVRAALPALRRSKGTIVSVSSMTGLVGQDRGAVYGATKGALVALTKSLAIELAADGIRVNCVCPAGVDTPLMRAWAATLPDPDAILREQASMHLMNRMASPAEVAEAVFFLASDAASFITGVALPVEGGATLGYRGVTTRR